MKYFLDTEFIEGTQKSIFNNKPTIDLISIGIVCEDGREYYAISKDFNLKEAWNRYQIKIDDYGIEEKVYWLRDNVIKPIFIELYLKHNLKATNTYDRGIEIHEKMELFIKNNNIFNYKNFKKLLNKYGKTNKQIAEEIKDFVSFKGFPIIEMGSIIDFKLNSNYEDRMKFLINNNFTPQFYGYYSDYDWVVFCWLFGKMIDLPKGFPMYCIDLKQELVKKQSEIKGDSVEIDRRDNYPKQTNEHNALADARWNYELYKFLNTL